MADKFRLIEKPDQASLILDIGLSTTKYGMARDHAPRGIIPTPLKISKIAQNSKSQEMFKHLQNSKELAMDLEEFLQTLFTMECKADLKGTNLVILESL